MRCPTGEVADSSRTRCICPGDTYNSTRFAGNTIQCLPEYHNDAVAQVMAATKCVSCAGLQCVRCSEAGPRVRSGWSLSGAQTPSATNWFVFQCPEESACLNEGGGFEPGPEQHKCRNGHEGQLCNTCKDGWGMSKNLCEPCNDTNSSPVTVVALLGLAAVLGALVYWIRQQGARANTPSALKMQLTDNPLAGNDSTAPFRNSLSLQATVQHSENAFMLLRVCYQPGRILIG